MGPPNHITPHIIKDSKGTQRDASETIRSRTVAGEKTSLELLLESTERTLPFSDTPQFGLLRDSLVFNHERILNHSPPHNHPLHNSNNSSIQSRLTTQHHYPSLNTINSQTNNYLETTTPQMEAEYVPKLYSVADRTAQNMANANLDRHVGLQLQQQQVPEGLGATIGNDFSSLTRGQVNNDLSGDIPLTNTAASLHLPSPPASEFFRGAVEPSVTTVTTVYEYKCLRTNKHVGGDNSLVAKDSFSDPLYEERTQEMPYPYNNGTGVLHHHQTNIDHVTPEDRESEEQMEVDPQPEDNIGHNVETKLNSTNLQTIPAPALGDHATDEDFDDELNSPTTHQPMFPNVEDLKWPELGYLRATLDPKYLPLLEPNYKKDCRSWLWKNEKGRKARELLALGKTTSKPSLLCYQSRPTSSDVQNTKKAFSDNDELEEDDLAVSLRQ